MTQSSFGGLMAVVVWAGALVCMEDRLETLAPKPSAPSAALGLLLLVTGLWRGTSIAYMDSASYVLAVWLGLGLALLCVPIRQLARFASELAVLALLPGCLLFVKLMPERFLSEGTAGLTTMVLNLLGTPARWDGRLVALEGGAVNVAGVCNGVDLMAQVSVVAVIFLLAFRIRSPWRILGLLLIAPVIAVVSNTLRIAFLAVINASDWAYKMRFFDFFHEEYGGYLFAGLAVLAFGWIYLRVLERDLAARRLQRSAA
ncbi:MAG: exosortase/archaeosortase family protein [Rubrivivax sp.]|nr:exosortase/archaeosortase family protein [Rubrivivax sp.]